MPIYVFRCEQCGNVMEEYYHYIDSPLTLKCTQCNSMAPRVIPAAAVVTKGYEEERRQISQLLKEDQKKIEKGDENFIHNLVGDAGGQSQVASGIKKMRGNQMGAIKRLKP